MIATARQRPVVTITADQSLDGLLGLVRNCRVCEAGLPLGPCPVLQVGSTAHDASQVVVIPMGLCYPGRGQGGDLPPRRECADLWLDPLLARLPRIELTLLIGLHAQRHFPGRRRKASLTETVKAWREFAPDCFPLPHPSTRNTPWFQRNPWFEHDRVPALRRRVDALKLSGASA